MDRDRFEAEVIALASEGTPVTVANVAARTRVAPRKAEAMLDEMVRGGHLESDVDESAGLLVYRVRGLTAAATRKRIAVDVANAMPPGMVRAAGEVLVRQAATQAKHAVMNRKPGEKSVLAGLGLGAIFGPFGLAYAAPWSAVVISALCYVGLAWLPIIKHLFPMLVIPIHIVMALAGALYVLRYNRSGRRSPLLPPAERDTAR